MSTICRVVSNFFHHNCGLKFTEDVVEHSLVLLNNVGPHFKNKNCQIVFGNIIFVCRETVVLT